MNVNTAPHPNHPQRTLDVSSKITRCDVKKSMMYEHVHECWYPTPPHPPQGTPDVSSKITRCDVKKSMMCEHVHER